MATQTRDRLSSAVTGAQIVGALTVISFSVVLIPVIIGIALVGFISLL